MKQGEREGPVCLLTLAEVQRRAGLSKTQVWRLARRGAFPAPIHVGRSARWPSDRIDAWVGAVIAANAAGRDP
ncbi:helix-turn-helix transcriptional regulator [Lysobacter claricitrinus]|uniref:helix-turn-helix transcriptional regulator n=1 Tax=Lysobacter claricitrinus TaxID=3367728 RepID=UPI0038B2ECAD